jgi:hypothetical protein
MLGMYIILKYASQTSPSLFFETGRGNERKKTLGRLENSFHLFKKVLTDIPGSGYMIYRDCTS